MIGNREVALPLSPQFDLSEIGEVDGGREYRSHGDDPQFGVADPASLARLSPGWWRLRWRLEARDGWMVTPKIYLDYGDGFSEAGSIELREPDDSGLSDTIVRIERTVYGVRLDPTAREARFVAGPPRLTRLPRIVAAYRMQRALEQAMPASPSATRQARWRLLRQLLSRQRTRVAGALWNSYLAIGALPHTSYALWYRLYTPLVAHLRRRAEGLRTQDDGVAIVMHAAGATPAALGATLDSVRDQLWAGWSLKVAIPELAAPDVRALLKARAREDARIHLVGCPGAGWPQELVESVREPLVMMLEPGAILAPHATSEFAHARAAMPDAKVFYCDSDTWFDARSRVDPCFKPAWNAVLFDAHDYIGPSWAASTDGLRVAIADQRTSHAPDLLRACLMGLDERQVVHIPKMLYHRAPAAGTQAPVAPPARPLSDGPKVSIVIPTRDRLPLLRTCVAGVRERTDYSDAELVVIDNGSTEAETLEYLADLGSQPRCRVVRDDSPFNFSALVNLGALSSDGEFLCLLNNDIEVISGQWLGELMAHAIRPGVGAVGAKLYYPDDTVQHGGILLGIGGVAGHAHHGFRRGDAGYQGRADLPQELSGVTAACMVVRREAFEEVGGFDESFPVAFNDVDFCLRLRQAGWRIVYAPRCELYHHESVSRGKEDTQAKQARFDSEVARMRERWSGILISDPAYNPNLTLDASDFSPSFPPRLDLVGTHLPSHWWQSRPVRTRA